MPCRPEEASSLPPHYEQKGLLGPDGDWLSKRPREHKGGWIAIASPDAPPKFDGLTGAWSQATDPRMRMAGESMRGIASTTEQNLMKLFMMFS
jgi:hypothetical protein